MNATHWPFSRALLVLVALEALYFLLTRWLISSGDPDSIGIEIARTLLRLLSAGAVWYFLSGVLEKPRVGRWKTSVWGLLPVLAVACALAVPVICGNWNLPEGETRFVFALASLAVGFREELVYRGVLQTLLEKKLGLRWAIVITTAVFAVYHYGAQPWTWFTVSQYIAFGVIFGLLYARTRSLWLVVSLHTLYDVIWCYTPLIENPWEQQRTLPLLAAAALLVLVWFIFSRRAGEVSA